MSEILKKFLIENVDLAHLAAFIGFVMLMLAWMAYSQKLRQFLADSQDRLSMGRLLCFVVTMVYVFSIGYVAVSKGVITDFPVAAGGLVAALYGINKFSPQTT